MSIFSGKSSINRIGPITIEMTKRLSNIFAFRAGAWAPPGPIFPSASHGGNRPNIGTYGPGDGAGVDRAVKSHFRPPYAYSETLFVGVPFSDNGFQLRRRYADLFHL